MVKNPWDNDNQNNQNNNNNKKNESDNDTNKTKETLNFKNKQLNDFKKKTSEFIKASKSKYWSKFLKSPAKYAILIVLFIWFATGFYTVNTNEQAAVLRFGKYIVTKGPGLHYHLPYPIETAIVENVTQENKIEIGFRTTTKSFYTGNDDENKIDIPSEGVMLTGDENVVKADFTVVWNIKNLKNYLFKIRNQEDTIKIVSESVIREIVGQDDLLNVLFKGREEIQIATKIMLQKLLDDYESGVNVKRIQLLKVEPPEQVIDSYKDIQRAQLDAQSVINQAEAVLNQKVPEARGEAEKITKSAEAYKAKIVNKATGNAKRFAEVLKEYNKAKDITKKRMYIDTMENILKNANVTILDKNTSNNTLPYLPLKNKK